MNIVITMAGAGTRFRKAGYTVPKYQIEAHSKTLFEWAMLSLEDFRSPDNRYIFIVRQEDKAEEFISKQCSTMKLDNYAVLQLETGTDGQATTVMKAIPYCYIDEPLLIYNIDTFVEPGEMKVSDIVGDGFIPCFKAPGDHWSFVKLGEKGKVVEVREKERISENCTLGAYYFNSCSLYTRLYHEYYGQQTQEDTEKYVAPLYNKLILEGGEVLISIVPYDRVHVLGTPEELNVFINTYKL